MAESSSSGDFGSGELVLDLRATEDVRSLFFPFAPSTYRIIGQSVQHLHLSSCLVESKLRPIIKLKNPPSTPPQLDTSSLPLTLLPPSLLLSTPPYLQHCHQAVPGHPGSSSSLPSSTHPTTQTPSCRSYCGTKVIVRSGDDGMASIGRRMMRRGGGTLLSLRDLNDWWISE
jgi:hypothetical protein